MEAFSGGAWRSIARGEVFTGSSWRRVTRVEIYSGGAWRNALTFVPAMTVTANSVSGAEYTSSFRPVRVTSNPSVATPVGGLAPYSYAWSVTSGAVTIISPSNASTTFYQVLGAGQTDFATAQVICSDALGSTATADINITLENIGGSDAPFL